MSSSFDYSLYDFNNDENITERINVAFREKNIKAKLYYSDNCFKIYSIKHDPNPEDSGSVAPSLDDVIHTAFETIREGQCIKGTWTGSCQKLWSGSDIPVGYVHVRCVSAPLFIFLPECVVQERLKVSGELRRSNICPFVTGREGSDEELMRLLSGYCPGEWSMAGIRE
ncbi:hypothetical protein BO94DRAFT_575639 [Aspergillus sclerotioniger CBS 115572]|uniref:Uncharacterized protein n=1 Tax=Aspergillus sclerotioniger CBS 115572 TaxID=1450535 RepID=A0A317WNT1_9EURO|nr:hypothetical protein BO94DRAFT_575639 [Aspergillus sclerotioniger CBS 115572]PWY86588.1 hypothetical protein BO94DRAFT_575639 [Aspergillus sclerotioniger CBS 115572]